MALDKEKGLIHSQRFFQTMFEQVPCYITVQDRDFNLLAVNKMFEDDFGRGVGEKCYAAYKGRDGVCLGCSVATTFEDGQVHSSEETVIRQDGSRVHFLVQTAPLLDHEGDITAVMEISTDVTAIRRLEEQTRISEEKYRLLFNNDPTSTVLLDQSSLEILDANDRAAADYLCSREDLVGRSLLDLVASQERNRVRKALRGGETFIPQVELAREEGRRFFANIRAAYSEHAGRSAIIVSLADITAHLAAEQQLIQASKMTTLGEMAAGVAHELNQPLTVIGTGAIFMLKRLKKDQAIAPDVALEVTEEILAQVERASRIINHLREFGRKAEVARSKVDINQPIRGVFGLLGQQLRIRNITAETDLAPELPTIWADVNRLEQVFVNLVINARDAIEQRRAQAPEQFDGRIEVRSFVENSQVVVTVRDNGAGIEPQDKDRILEPFYTTKEVGHGTGLGLSISYGIVTDYKGSIEVDSQLDQGTTFRLTFPAAEEESS